MKSMNFKSILAAFALTLAFVFAGVESGRAQGLQSSLGGDFYAPPAGSFVGVDQAQQRLDLAITAVKENLAISIPGTPLYKVLQAKWFYYTGINQAIVDGKTVPVSIVTPLPALTSDEGGYFLGKTDLANFKEEAIALLTP